MQPKPIKRTLKIAFAELQFPRNTLKNPLRILSNQIK